MTEKKIARIILTMMLAALIIMPAAGIAERAQAQAQAAELHIVCTNSALADFARELGGDDAKVEYIMPAGVCPAFFDARPSDVSLVGSADVIVSLGWEPWLTDLLTASGNTGAVQIKCPNMGQWNLPEGAKAYVDKIAKGLADALPNLNKTVSANAVSYKAEIDEKSSEIKALAHAARLEGKQVACMEWQKGFLEFLGLDVVAWYASPAGLSTEDMLNITTQIEENEVAAIVDNLQSGTDFGANVASQTGVAHVIFSNFPEAIPGTDTYLDMIDYNTRQLIDGIEGFEHDNQEIASLEDDVENLEMQRLVLISVSIVLGILALLGFLMYFRKG